MIAPELRNGDLVFENGNWVFIDGDEELAQSVRATLKMRRGEFFLEPEAGMVYDNLLGKRTNEDELRDDIIEAVSQEERVRAVSELNIITNERARKRETELVIEKEDGGTLRINAGFEEGGI